MEYIDELRKPNSFSIFTKLVKKKINGSLLSEENLTIGEKSILKNLSHIDKKYFFECPECGKHCLINEGEKTFNCDCDNTIQIDDDLEKEVRYSINEEAYNQLKTKINQEFENNSNYTIKGIFDGKKSDYTFHDSAIYLHFTPFASKEILGDFNCLSDAYLDHFIINWNSLPGFIDNKDRVIQNILQYRKENIEKQIDWSKIDEWKFQNLVYELIDKERIFHKLSSGGKGPDQGKDMLGYSFIEPLGKPEEVITLIQCKFTKKGTTYKTKGITSYLPKAKRHKCNYILFITNGYLSGDTITEIHSDAYRTETLRDISSWDNHKLTLLLEKHTDIRLKYFFTK